MSYQEDMLREIADAIREKTGEAGTIPAAEFAERIREIRTAAETFLQRKTVSPSSASQTVRPDPGYDGLSSVTVNAARLQSRSVSPSGSEQTVTPGNGYYGLASVAVGAVTMQEKTVAPTRSAQTIRPDSGYTGLESVVVEAYEIKTQSKTVTASKNAQIVRPDSGFDGLSQVTVGGYTPALQEKSVTPSGNAQEVTPDGSYDGLSKVTVAAVALQAKTATPTKAQQTITADSGYSGLSRVSVSAIPAQYQDVSAVTATAGDVLAGKIFVDSSGNVITGTMTAARLLPEGYTQLEYIQSGSSQYINTGVVFNVWERDANTNTYHGYEKIFVDFEVVSGYGSVVGSSISTAQSGSNSYRVGINSSGLIACYIGQGNSGWQSYSGGRTAVTVNTYTKVFSVNGTEYAISTNTGVGVPYEICVLASRSSTGVAENFLNAKLYRCTMWQGPDTIRDFIPCKNPDNVVGVYDIINGAFYGNGKESGAAFIAGPEV